MFPLVAIGAAIATAVVATVSSSESGEPAPSAQDSAPSPEASAELAAAEVSGEAPRLTPSESVNRMIF